ncbi:hypothetical protein, partial [Mesorhizobium japonicum]|uniref:hypothetical protein n=1 Tax=Mesorhizobium japonicum TaxID=2066070 RepID=UPI003B58BDF2
LDTQLLSSLISYSIALGHQNGKPNNVVLIIDHPTSPIGVSIFIINQTKRPICLTTDRPFSCRQRSDMLATLRLHLRRAMPM